MAAITINVPAAQVNRVLDAMCTRFGYTGFEADGITPQSKSEFVRKLIIKYVKDNVAAHEAATAAAVAFTVAENDVQNNVNIT